MSKTAVISGVGSGLGAALVRKFASEGYQVGLLARSSDYIQELAEELLQEGVRALAVPTDITDPQQVTQSFARVREELGASFPPGVTFRRFCPGARGIGPD